MTDQEIDAVFTYHAPFGTQPARYTALRQAAKELARLVAKSCPESREKSLAITSLQATVMWANAAIAIHESGD
jgi:hypothetical protein